MRASRLLQILLLLQNRGRLTSRELAEEVEVTPRTILRDVDAMTEAGLPIVVLQGNQGGIELGFNYRTRLTGLDQSEAEALGVVLNAHTPALETLGMGQAFRSARTKLVESFPDKARLAVLDAMERFHVRSPEPEFDPRIEALANAVRTKRKVRINANCEKAQIIHPTALKLSANGWCVTDAITALEISLRTCGDLNISAHQFQ